MRHAITGFVFAVTMIVSQVALPAHAGSGAEWIINYTGTNKDVLSLVATFNKAGTNCTQGKKVPRKTLDQMEGLAKQMARQPYAKTQMEGNAIGEVVSGVGWMRQLCAK